jgi:hypothetical protein
MKGLALPEILLPPYERAGIARDTPPTLWKGWHWDTPPTLWKGWHCQRYSSHLMIGLALPGILLPPYERVGIGILLSPYALCTYMYFGWRFWIQYSTTHALHCSFM